MVAVLAHPGQQETNPEPLPETGATLNSIVIGAGYGDEGKGLVTDYLCSKSARAVAVRFNGGAQAGHTVQSPDGRRHVFHHFGSGALAGARTFLGRRFVSSPMWFGKERAQLISLGANVNIGVDRGSLITTPYDVMINRALESSRGGARHGSCGMGMNETITRSETELASLTAGDLGDVRRLRSRLESIRHEYVPQRLAQLGLTTEMMPMLGDERVLNGFIADCEHFWQCCDVSDSDGLRDLVMNGFDLVMEGAQGLMLREDHPNFPHVTRSRTGIANAVELLRELDVDAMATVHYVTRCYATRHGAGPLPHELVEKPWPGVIDETNVPNGYQGSLRFAWLDLNILVSEVNHDLAGAAGSVIPVVVMTCVDQIQDEKALPVVEDGVILTASAREVLEALMWGIGATDAMVSRGPTRKDCGD